MRIWDLERNSVSAELLGHEGAVATVAISPDGETALSAGLDTVVRHWDLKTGKQIGAFQGHERPVWAVAFTPDGKRALSSGHDAVIRIWSLADYLDVPPAG